MTEAEWFETRDPDELLWERRGRTTTRKLRLVGCGCCRRRWSDVGEQAVRQVVVDAEKYADAELEWSRFQSAASQIAMSSDRLGSEHRRAAFALVWPNKPPPEWEMPDDEPVEVTDPEELADYPIRCTRRVLSLLREAAGIDYLGRGRSQIDHPDEFLIGVQREAVAQCQLVHDIFGNPFCPVGFSTEWRTDTVLALARQMYESREFGAMPILADALQDAGCDSDEVLSHCRGAGPHVRGCWVVDLVLQKE